MAFRQINAKSENMDSNHYENLPMQYKEAFKVLKHDNFQQEKIDIFSFCSKHRLWLQVRTASIEAFLTSTHNLRFGANIRKIGMLLHTPVLLYKSGV